VRAGDAAAPSLDPSRIPVNNNSFDVVQEPVVAPKPQPKPQPKPVEKPQPQPAAGCGADAAA
jgi:DedD protein